MRRFRALAAGLWLVSASAACEVDKTLDASWQVQAFPTFQGFYPFSDAVLGTVAILLRRNQPDKALAELRKLDLAKSTRKLEVPGVAGLRRHRLGAGQDAIGAGPLPRGVERPQCRAATWTGCRRK